MHADEQEHAIDRDPHPKGAARFLGRACSFNASRGGSVERLVGVIDGAQYIGRTERGQIPDYRLTIRGHSGATLTVPSMVEAYTSFQEPI